MLRLSPEMRFGFTIGLAALGGVAGLLIGVATSEDNVLGLGFAGAVIGLNIGGIIFRQRKEKQIESTKVEEEQHYSLPEEMRDGYHEQLVMKRIMEIYHPEGNPFEDEEEDEQDEPEADAEEEEPDERFAWIDLNRDRDK